MVDWVIPSEYSDGNCIAFKEMITNPTYGYKSHFIILKGIMNFTKTVSKQN